MKRGPRGFTLLEVLISIMIFVLAIAAILPLFALATTSHKRGIDQSHVALIAPRIAAKLQENLYAANPADVTNGRWEEYGASYLYDAKFTPLSAGFPNDPAPQTAFLLKVSVKWKETSEERAEVFETVVLRKILR